MKKIVRIIIETVLVVVMILSFSICSKSQTHNFIQVPLNMCTDSSVQAKFTVKEFLASSSYASLRDIAGFDSEKEEMIAPVTNDSVCSRLHEIINGDETYNNINVNKKNSRRLYFYKTNNFYFMFWSGEPGYIILTPTNPFCIVVKNDFSAVYDDIP